MWKLGLKKSLTIAALCVMGAVMIGGCGNGSGSGNYKVGVLQLAEHPALDAANKGFVDGLASKGFKDNVKIDQQNAQGDQSNLNTIAQRFVADRPDLVVAIATPAVQAMANASHDIPILGTAVTSYVNAKLVDSNEHPGGNVSGTTDMIPMDNRVKLIKALVPNAKKIGTIYSSSEINSQVQADEFKKLAAAEGMELVTVTVSNVNDVPQAANDLLTKGVDAVYFPTDNIVASSYSNLVSILGAKKLPIFPSDDTLLKYGGLGAYSVDFYKLGFQTGEMAAKILSGEAKVEDMPIESQSPAKLVINQEEAKKLGITIPADLLKEASSN